MKKKDKSTGKKKKAATKAGRKDGSIRTTQAAAKKINAIAQRIYDLYPGECRKAGYYRPSAKLAVDYLILSDISNQRLLSEKEAMNDNMYYKLRTAEQGGE